MLLPDNVDLADLSLPPGVSAVVYPVGPPIAEEHGANAPENAGAGTGTAEGTREAPGVWE